MENTLSDNAQINIKELLAPYFRKWKLFIVSVVTFFIFAFIYLKFQNNQYKITASILVKDEQKNQVQDQLSDFSNLGFDLGGVKSKLENEIEILKSRTLLMNVVKDLNLNVSYFESNKFLKSELYKKTAVDLKIISDSKSLKNKDLELVVTFIDDISFSLENKNEQWIKTFTFGQKVKTKYGDFVIIPLNKRMITKDKSIIIKISSLDRTVDNLRKLISIEPTNKESSSITLSMNYSNVEKATSIINSLIKHHKTDAINDKNELNKNTIKFIDERLTYITDDLSNVESNVSDFKSENQIFDIATNTGLYFQNESDVEKEILKLNTQLNLADYVYEYLITSNEKDLIPSNLGIDNMGVEKNIESLNSLILERNKLLISSKDKNPIVLNLNDQIDGLKNALKESLKNQKNSLKIQLKSLQRKNQEISNKLNSAPKQEKNFKEIARQQQIKETLYLYLLQKREETSLALAVASANTKIIDSAYSDNIPISPKRKIIYLASILLGLLFPAGIIYLIMLLDTKLKGREDLESIKIPVIGELPLVKNNNLIIKRGDRSNIAEAVRIIRTNLSFLLNKNNSECNTIFVTSTFSSEGKSFVSINLASSLAMTDKKVLLIGLDLRMPKLLEYIGEVGNSGVTNYIVNNDLSLNDIILRSDKLSGVDIIPSGIIPPNPAELLMTDRMSNLLKEAKVIYDYIIVDTAPVGLVTDTLLIKDFADVTLYITRAGVLEKKSLSILKDIYENKKLNNISALVNGIDLEAGYGYGYGKRYVYGGYVEEDESKTNKIINYFKKNNS